MTINEEAREELLAEVGDMSDENLNKKPATDKWSVKQVLEHLYLMEKAITKTVQDELTDGEIVSIKDKPIHLTVNRNTKVEAPGFAKPSEAFATLEELKRNLAESHQGLISLVKAANDTLLEQKALPHPGFKMMSLKQWIPFVGWHEKRHILQIKEVKEKIGL